VRVEHIGTKTAVQIGSHAQMFFTKVVTVHISPKFSDLCYMTFAVLCSAGSAPAIQIPLPRPKRKPAHPVPRKVDDAAKKQAPMLRQLEKPPAPRMQSLRQQDDGSPMFMRTAAQTALWADALDGVVFSNTSGRVGAAARWGRSDEQGRGKISRSCR
jgi:hypothetical protein